MELSPPLGASPQDSDDEFTTFFRQYQALMRCTAVAELRRGPLGNEDLEEAVKDLVQNTCIRLLEARTRRPIQYPVALIRITIRHLAQDVHRHYRRQKPTIPLHASEDNELSLSEQIAANNEGERDPAYELDLHEPSHEFLACLVRVIKDLPQCQQQAMLWKILQAGPEVAVLTEALKKVGIDLDHFEWPRDESERQRLRASFFEARKRLGKALRQSQVEAMVS